jgi:sodium-dependent dicarboxylate transporter 2/3/5
MMQQYWRKFIIGFGFLSFFLVLFFTGAKSTFWNSIALGGLMIFFWLFEVFPIYVTALFPFVLGVPLGILDTDQLAASYADKNVFLFLGGFVIALALEKWDVHLQISRSIISLVGKRKPKILLGFILTSGLLSMWISNTATTLMMLPIALAVTQVLPKSKENDKFSLFLLLSIAYAASIGGMATLVGSPPNLAMASILSKEYGIQIDFFSWMKIGLPVAILMLAVTYFYFMLRLGKARKDHVHDFDIKKQPWTTNQFRVIAVFLMVVIFWSFKGVFLPHLDFSYGDEGVAILGAILLFILPSTENKPLLKWKDTEKLPWGILLLFGGGTALATMLKSNGVVEYLSTVFVQYNSLPYIVLLIVIVSIAIFGTEIMSNFALVAAFIPLIAQFAIDSNYSVLEMCIPVTLAASCAFMLPVGTPPNAIVFASGQIQINQMARYGFLLNIIALIVIVSACTLFL